MKMFDQKMLLLTYKDDLDILAEIVKEFSLQMPQMISDLENAYQSEDFKKMEISFHTFKGLSLTFCAQEISKFAFELEDLTKTLRLPTLEIFNDFIDRIEKLKEELVTSFL